MKVLMKRPVDKPRFDKMLSNVSYGQTITARVPTGNAVSALEKFPIEISDGRRFVRRPGKLILGAHIPIPKISVDGQKTRGDDTFLDLTATNGSLFGGEGPGYGDRIAFSPDIVRVIESDLKGLGGQIIDPSRLEATFPFETATIPSPSFVAVVGAILSSHIETNLQIDPFTFEDEDRRNGAGKISLALPLIGTIITVSIPLGILLCNPNGEGVSYHVMAPGAAISVADDNTSSPTDRDRLAMTRDAIELFFSPLDGFVEQRGDSATLVSSPIRRFPEKEQDVLRALNMDSTGRIGPGAV